ncbi:MAG: polysaccharide biosynthesis/export family protein [Verrucomicrobiales bacterium]
MNRLPVFASTIGAGILLLALLCPSTRAQVGARMPLAPRTPPSSDTRDATAAVATASSMEVLDETRPLELGDILAFRILEDRAAPYSLVITDSGDVEVPLIGRVSAEGKSCKQLAYEIKEELEKEYYQEATVIVALDWAGTRQQGYGDDAASAFDGRVNVWGAVNREGPVWIPVKEGLKITDAILAAGGFTPFAKRTKVKVHRILNPEVAKEMSAEDGAQEDTPSAPPQTMRTAIITVNVKDIMEKGRLSKDITLKPNDVIIVDEKLFNF